MRHQIVLGTLALSIVATPAFAQGSGTSGTTFRDARAMFAAPLLPAAPMRTAVSSQTTPAPKKVTVVTGSDAPSLYIFRGLVQESDANFTFQPFVDVGVAASDTLAVNFGTWNSFHSGSLQDAFGTWYESDLYISTTATVGKVKPGVLWTSYTSPSDAYKAVHELATFVSFDDSANKVPVSPKIVLAFEVAGGQGDGGQHKGIYLETGMKPTFKPGGSSVTVGIPVKLGFSLKDYYEGANGDSKFGYFDIGANVSVPLANLKNGAWEIHGGVDVFTFGDMLKDYNGARSKTVASVGFSATF